MACAGAAAARTRTRRTRYARRQWVPPPVQQPAAERRAHIRRRRRPRHWCPTNPSVAAPGTPAVARVRLRGPRARQPAARRQNYI